MKRLLLVGLLSAVVLAGCAADPGPGSEGDDGDDGDDATPPAPMTNEAAGSLLTRAIQDMPETFAIDMKATSGTTELLTFKASFDNKTRRTYVELKGDAETLGKMGGGGGEGMGAMFANGISMYTSPSGSLYLANGTAFVFPPSDGTGAPGGMIPRPEDGPLGSVLAGDEILGAFAESGVQVTSVTPTTYRGKPAIEVVARHTEDDQTTTGKLIVFTSPERIAHLETTLPMDPANPADPFSGASLSGDFYYEGELKLEPPQSVVRALGLAYATAATGNGITWTFRGTEGIATTEVEVHVKKAEGSSGPDPTQLPTAWTMTLSEGERTHEGLTLTFTDADSDGRVSANDTLVATPDDETIMPPLVLYDRVTGTYVVPSAGVWLALAAMALALVLLRRN